MDFWKVVSLRAMKRIVLKSIYIYILKYTIIGMGKVTRVLTYLGLQNKGTNSYVLYGTGMQLPILFYKMHVTIPVGQDQKHT